MQIDGHINTMNRPGLRAGPIEKEQWRQLGAKALEAMNIVKKCKFPSYISLLHAPLAPPAPPATTITPFIFSSSRRSTGLHRHVYSRPWPIKIIRTDSGTRAASIHLFRMFWGFRFQQNSVPLVTDRKKTIILTKLKPQILPNKYLTKL